MMKEKLNKKGNKMRLGELTFDTDYCDDSPNLTLVDEFFDTTNEPTTTGRTYTGVTGGHSQRHPHTFGLMENVQSESDQKNCFRGDS